jgi:hypothetical protein
MAIGPSYMVLRLLIFVCGSLFGALGSYMYTSMDNLSKGNALGEAASVQWPPFGERKIAVCVQGELRALELTAKSFRTWVVNHLGEYLYVCLYACAYICACILSPTTHVSYFCCAHDISCAQLTWLLPSVLFCQGQMYSW